jgi:plastocyanin
VRRRLLLSLLLLLSLPAVAACGSDGGEEGDEGGAALETVEVVGTEFKLEPSTVELAEPGTYTFRFRNEGGTVHALEIEGNGLEDETEEIDAGETAELTVDLEAGEYELYCPVGNHRDQGMEGTVVVGGGAGGGGTTTDGTTTDETTTEDSDDDSGYGYG